MSARLFIFASLLACAFGSIVLGQNTERENPKDAYIRVINCCDTDQDERWRTGLDLKFKDSFIGKDIRIGRRGPVGKISFVGKDTIEVYRTGDYRRPIASLPATLRAGGFYSVIVMGDLGARQSDVIVKLVEENPVEDEERPPGTARMQVLNAVKKYPVAFRPQGVRSAPIPKFSELTTLHLPYGENKMELLYRDEKGRNINVPWVVDIVEGGDYLTAIHPSRDFGNLPSVYTIDLAEVKKQLLAPQEDVGDAEE